MTKRYEPNREKLEDTKRKGNEIQQQECKMKTGGYLIEGKAK